MTEQDFFKARYNNHNSSFNNAKQANSTALSKHIWALKNNNTDFQIKWGIVKHARSYNGHPSKCNLFLAQKLCILTSKDPGLVNKRSKLVTKCRQENKYYAANQSKSLRGSTIKYRVEHWYLAFSLMIASAWNPWVTKLNIVQYPACVTMSDMYTYV